MPGQEGSNLPPLETQIRQEPLGEVNAPNQEKVSVPESDITSAPLRSEETRDVLFAQLLQSQEAEINSADMLDMILAYPSDLDEQLEACAKNQGINLNIAEARNAERIFETLLSRSEDETPEQKLALNYLKKIFMGIAAKGYYSSEELESFFSQISYQENSESETQLARIEDGKLTIFDNLLKAGKNGERDQEKIEFILLHEIAHIIDKSGILNAESEFENEGENFGPGLESIIKSVPAKFNDPYSISCMAEGENVFLLEAAAHLIATWSKHRGDFDGFLLERLARMNPETQKAIFGPNINRALLQEAITKNALDLRDLAVDKESYDQVYQNSIEMFDYFENGWDYAKENLGDAFYEKIRSLGEFDITDYYDQEMEDLPEENSNEQPGEDESDGQPIDDKDDGTKTQGAKTKSKRSFFGEIFASGKAMFASFNDLDIFFGNQSGLPSNQSSNKNPLQSAVEPSMSNTSDQTNAEPKSDMQSQTAEQNFEQPEKVDYPEEEQNRPAA